MFTRDVYPSKSANFALESKSEPFDLHLYFLPEKGYTLIHTPVLGRARRLQKLTLVNPTLSRQPNLGYPKLSSQLKFE